MRYVGGKSRIAGWVADEILKVRGERQSYLEPFVGSGAVFAKLAPHFTSVACGDAHEDLVMLWRAVAAGWVPPESVSREEYNLQRTAAPSAMRAFVGYGSSFSGKWFGGYINSAWDSYHQRQAKPHAQAASRSLVKVAPIFAQAKIHHRRYVEWSPGPGDVVYCDPPYADTLGYPAAGERFDSAKFWEVAAAWADAGALVVVSEERAPEGWVILAERERAAFIRGDRGKASRARVERLYVREAHDQLPSQLMERTVIPVTAKEETVRVRRMHVEPLTPGELEALKWATQRGRDDLVETGEMPAQELAALDRAMSKLATAQAKVGKP